MNREQLNNLDWHKIGSNGHTAAATDGRFLIYVDNITKIHSQYDWRYTVIDLDSTQSVNDTLNMKASRHGVYSNLVPDKELAKTLILEIINNVSQASNTKDQNKWP